ncbi:MMPL family transporter [Phaeovibrio sulfidiphilus]|uniref:MMPL family transporter n=1 Tax=Phaeovibrio sulfidiphilus TaxID=1220600 RepID=A0A8J6YN65_9PROT|nr:MMPL family transporter [Phaeovibrio sulfidiphilus]MBE1237735.1 MMPL family transporter [Phaeovibrio sulfidiphilus]
MQDNAVSGNGSFLKRIDSFIASMVVSWVRTVRKAPVICLFAVVLLTGLSAAYAVHSFSIRTDTESMLSSDLPFQKNQARFTSFFPDMGDELVVVIDAADAGLAEQASHILVSSLSQQKSVIVSAVDFEDLPYFRKNGLLYLSTKELGSLSDDLARAQPFLSVLAADPSLHGLEKLLDLIYGQTEHDTSEFDAVLPGILGNMTTVTGAVAANGEHSRRQMPWSHIFQGSGSEGLSETRRLILVRPVLDHTGFEPAGQAIEAVNRIARDAGLIHENGVDFCLTGAPVLDQDELESVKSGMLWPSLISFLSVTLLLVAGMRSGWLIVGMLSALLSGLAITAGFAFVSVGTLNLISVTFAVLFIGLSVDFGLHYGLRYRENRIKAMDNAEALESAARTVGTPLVLSALSAMIAFFSFLPTQYIGLAQLGLISGVGMAAALLLNLTCLPAVLTLFPPTFGAPSEQPGRLARLKLALENYPVRRPRVVAALALVLAVASGSACLFLRFDTDPLSLKDPNTESMVCLAKVFADPRINPYQINVLAEGRDQAVERTRALEALPEVGGVVNLMRLVPEGQKEKLSMIEDLSFVMGPGFMSPVPVALDAGALLDARQAMIRQMSSIALHTKNQDLAAAARTFSDALGAFPPSPDALSVLDERLFDSLSTQIARIRDMLEVSAPVTVQDIPPELASRYLAADGQTYRLEVHPSADVRGGGAALNQFANAVARVAPNDSSGDPMVITEAGRTVIGAFILAASITLVLVVGLVLMVFQTVREVILVFVPVILAGLLTMATAVLIGMPLNLANVIVLPLLVGLGVAGAIHVLGRARLTPEDLASVIGSSTPRAVTYSALTTIASFGSLAISTHLGTRSMGILLTLALVYALFCNLWILPALAALWPGKGAAAQGGERGGDE